MPTDTSISLRNSKREIARWKILLVSFGIPIFLIGFIYILNNIFPFGDEMYLRMDMYHQYAPFLKQFQTILKEGGSLEYSWKIGLGSNFFATYAYYLASPFNWLVGLLPSRYIPEIMNAFILLKAGLMSLSFSWYLLQKFNKQSFIAACFGIMYAMSGYFVAYSWNVMWLDALVLLPFLFYGMELLVKEKRFEFYTVALALTILSNYYIGLIVCIWTVLYFIYLLVSETRKQTISSIIKCIVRYVLSSLLAGCLSAVIWIPSFLALSSTASGGISFPEIFNIYFNPLEMFAHASYGSKLTLIEGYLPNIYCGMIIFLLLPLYFFNRHIKKKEKTGKAILILIFWFSFSCNFASFIWHGLHFPNSLPARQAFIYIAFILVMGYEAVIKMTGIKKNYIVWVGIAAGLALLILQVLFPETLSLGYTYVSILFLLCYIAVLCLMKSPVSILRNGMVVVLVVLCMCELVLNAFETGFSTANRTYYVSDNQAIEHLLEETYPYDLARIEKNGRRTKNDGAWSDYPSASLFSSIASKDITDFYEACGMKASMNSFGFSGHTQLTSALLRVKYILSKEPLDENWYSFKDSEDDMMLYQAKYVLPLGFLIDDFIYEKELEETSFDVQNRLLKEMKGLEPVFVTDHMYIGTNVVYYPKQNGRLYIELLSPVKNLKVTFDDNEKLTTRSFDNANVATVVEIGDVNTSMTLTFFSEEGEELSIIPSVMDEEAFKTAIQTLEEEAFQLEGYNDTHVNGWIDAKDDGILFLSIPNEKGWTAYVDGKEQKIAKEKSPFVMLSLTKGIHQIRMEYKTPGLMLGAIISVTSMCLFFAWLLMRWKHLRHQYLKENNYEKE